MQRTRAASTTRVSSVAPRRAAGRRVALVVAATRRDRCNCDERFVVRNQQTKGTFSGCDDSVSKRPARPRRTTAAALAQKEHWWVGPIRVPLDDLVRLAGPESDALVPIERDEWEGDVEEMEESLEEGWEPPPLLAEYQDGRLLLQDGNHRYEALVRADEEHAWVLVYFDDSEARDAFESR